MAEKRLRHWFSAGKNLFYHCVTFMPLPLIFAALFLE
jgi:hypothetical protein